MEMFTRTLLVDSGSIRFDSCVLEAIRYFVGAQVWPEDYAG